MSVILFVSASPDDQSRLRLDRETRDIQDSLARAPIEDRYSLEVRPAVRLQDLLGVLMHTKPEIVHFSGHGLGEGGICLEDESGESRPVSTEGLASLFALVAAHVRCVVLNACDTVTQARAIHPHVDFVMGMKSGITDNAARIFSMAFYRALGEGKGYEEAFNWARAAVQLAEPACQEAPVRFRRVPTPPVPQPDSSSKAASGAAAGASRPDAGAGRDVPLLSWSEGGLTPAQYKQMRTIFSQTYTDTQSIRLVCHDAGLSWSRINANGPAEVVWHAVLEEAERCGPQAVLDLVKVATSKYPDNSALAQLESVVRTAVGLE